ncbi:MAG: DUF11 domain-containing protein [bacterium]|nr:DUF11 domain-containing protein [bacterium]
MARRASSRFLHLAWPSLVIAAILIMPARADFRTIPWFNTSWHYRVPVSIPAGTPDGATASIDIDFGALLASMNVPGTLDTNSVRLVRPGGTLATTQEFTDVRFANVSDAAGNERGEVRFLVEDAGPATYYAYFDITANPAKAPWPNAQTINGSFEFGNSGWTTGNTQAGAANNEIHPLGGEGSEITLPTNPPTCSDSAATVNNSPRTGSNYHLTGFRTVCENGANNELAWVQRSFRVPNTASGNLNIRFRLQGFDSYIGDARYDWFRIRAGTSAINPPVINHTALTITPTNGLRIDAAGIGRNIAFGANYIDQGWRTATLPLAPYAGTTITVRFEMRYYTDQLYRTWIGLDDLDWSLVTAIAGTVEAFGANITDPPDTGSGAAMAQYDIGDTLSIVADAQAVVPAGRVVADVLDNAGQTVTSDIVLFDDGTHGDAVAGDHTWSNDGSDSGSPTYTFTTSDPVGNSWVIRVRARDGAGLARRPGAGAAVNQANYYNVDDQVFELLLSVSGRVYEDTQPNLMAEASEDWTGGSAVFVNLVQGGAVVGSNPVGPGTGSFSFASLTAGNYTVVVTDSAANPSPVQPGGWLFVEPTSGGLPLTLSTRALADQDLGLFKGSRVRGSVFRDDGAGGAVANDGIHDAGETGIGKVEIRATDAATTTTWDSDWTKADGSFELWLPAAIGSSTVVIVETNPSGYRSTGGSSGTTAGTYDRPTDALSFTNTPGTSYTGTGFGDVLENRFEANGQQSSLPGSVVFYAHTFFAESSGTVGFFTSQTTTPASPAFTAALFHDQNCDGLITPGEPELISPVPVSTGDRVCVIVRETIPEAADFGAQDSTQVTAVFGYANALPPLMASYSLTDLTTASDSQSAGLVLHKTVDLATALPGDTLVYSIEYTNTGSAPITDVDVFDSTPAFTTFLAASCGPADPGTSCTVTMQPTVGATGSLQWTISGTLPASGTGTVTYSVRID